MSNVAKPPTPTDRIRELNDRLRTQFVGGKIMRSAGVAGMEPEKQAAVLHAMREFKDFNADNDPYGEHDCTSQHCISYATNSHPATAGCFFFN
jgi:hypothetical protein